MRVWYFWHLFYYTKSVIVVVLIWYGNILLAIIFAEKQGCRETPRHEFTIDCNRANFEHIQLNFSYLTTLIVLGCKNKGKFIQMVYFNTPHNVCTSRIKDSWSVSLYCIMHSIVAVSGGITTVCLQWSWWGRVFITSRNSGQTTHNKTEVAV